MLVHTRSFLCLFVQPAPDDARTQLSPKYRVTVPAENGFPRHNTAGAQPDQQRRQLQAAQALDCLDVAANGSCAPASTGGDCSCSSCMHECLHPY